MPSPGRRRAIRFAGGARKDRRACGRIPIDPDKQVEILTERYNISPVMSPGEVDALIDNVIRDFEQHSENDADLVLAYRTMLVDFAKDWREVWHLYGFEKQIRSILWKLPRMSLGGSALLP